MAKLKINKDLAKSAPGVPPDGRNSAQLKEELDKIKRIAPAPTKLGMIVIREPFCSAYELEDETFHSIRASIASRGYDDTQPVIIWKTDGELTLLDGHRRVEASKRNDLAEIPARILPEETFESDEEALAYIRHLQHNRRNIGEAQKFAELLAIGNPAKLPGAGKTSKKVASLFGVSETTAKKYLAVIKEGEAYWNKILDPENAMTINKAYLALQEAKNPTPETSQEGGSTLTPSDSDEEYEDETTGRDEEPREVSFAEETDIGHQLHPPEEDPQDRVQRALVFFREDLLSMRVQNSNEIVIAIVDRLAEQGIIEKGRVDSLRKDL